MNINKKKNSLRRTAKAVRSLIKNKEDLSGKIAENLFSLDCYKNCESLFAYYSYSQEVSTRRIIEKAFQDGKRIALPRCESESEMSFYYIESDSTLESGKFKGIFEPGKNAKKAAANEKTLVLVPALAFGKDGSRLGHGKGFYDRFLAFFTGETVGLCFSKLLFDSLPEDEFDKRTSLVITENEIIRTDLSVQQK